MDLVIPLPAPSPTRALAVGALVDSRNLARKSERSEGRWMLAYLALAAATFAMAMAVARHPFPLALQLVTLCLAVRRATLCAIESRRQRDAAATYDALLEEISR